MDDQHPCSRNVGIKVDPELFGIEHVEVAGQEVGKMQCILVLGRPAQLMPVSSFHGQSIRLKGSGKKKEETIQSKAGYTPGFKLGLRLAVRTQSGQRGKGWVGVDTPSAACTVLARRHPDAVSVETVHPLNV